MSWQVTTTSTHSTLPTPSARDRLRQAGLRITAPRVAILGVLTRSTGHDTVGEVAELARARLGMLSTQAAYDVLNALADAGLAQRIELPGQPARFEARTGDNHHHMVCRVCGVVRDVDCAAGLAPCMDPVDARGFVVDEAEVTYWGLCPDCQQGGMDPDCNARGAT
ncbi:MAG: transcriptional repressor [Actinobacteria bacterium]|nr:transcriptional repressor [Actinomycetota bacterium]